jgi:hypothetical protein
LSYLVEHLEKMQDFVDCARYGELEDMKQMLDVCSSDIERLHLAKQALPESLNTALHYAAANGHSDIVKLLLELLTNSMDIDCKNSEGSTPLHWAALNGQVECVQLLANAGANPGLQNNTGKCPISLAEQQGHDKVVDCLLAIFEPEE